MARGRIIASVDPLWVRARDSERRSAGLDADATLALEPARAPWSMAMFTSWLKGLMYIRCNKLHNIYIYTHRPYGYNFVRVIFQT